MIAWDALKTEYASGQMSYRQLAQTHGVSYKTLYQHARIDHWADARRLHSQKTVRKSLDKIGDHQAEELARVDGLADELLDKLGKAIDELELTVIRHREKGEDEKGNQWQVDYEKTEPGGMVDRKGLQQLAATLKNLKQIKALQTELDKLEQEARIHRLQQEAREEDGGVRLILEGEALDYGK